MKSKHGNSWGEKGFHVILFMFNKNGYILGESTKIWKTSMFSIQHTPLEKAQNMFFNKNRLQKSLQKCWKFQFHLLKSYIIDQEQSNANPNKTTRWAPTSYKWSYKPYKWPYKLVTGVITLLIGVITPFITSRGPTLHVPHGKIISRGFYVFRCSQVTHLFYHLSHIIFISNPSSDAETRFEV